MAEVPDIQQVTPTRLKPLTTAMSCVIKGPHKKCISAKHKIKYLRKDSDTIIPQTAKNDRCQKLYTYLFCTNIEPQ